MELNDDFPLVVIVVVIIDITSCPVKWWLHIWHIHKHVGNTVCLLEDIRRQRSYYVHNCLLTAQRMYDNIAFDSCKLILSRRGVRELALDFGELHNRREHVFRLRHLSIVNDSLPILRRAE